MNITVLIPSFKRPNLLRTALQSISVQTYLSSIIQIIVSENGLDRESEKVCFEFSTLPIRYVYHDEQLSPQKHFKWLFSEVENGYCAFLCDDDWWSCMHVELAIRWLKISETKCYYSNFFYVQSEKMPESYAYYGSNGYSLVNERFSTVTPTVLTSEEVITHSYLFTSFHFSSMVCEADLLKASLHDFEKVSPTICDRILFANISVNSDVIFNPLATTLVRSHDLMDSKNYASEEWKMAGIYASEYIEKLARKIDFDVKLNWNKIYSKASKEQQSYVEKWVSYFNNNQSALKWFIGSDKIFSELNNDIKRKPITKYIIIALKRIKKSAKILVYGDM